MAEHTTATDEARAKAAKAASPRKWSQGLAAALRHYKTPSVTGAAHVMSSPAYAIDMARTAAAEADMASGTARAAASADVAYWYGYATTSQMLTTKAASAARRHLPA